MIKSSIIQFHIIYFLSLKDVNNFQKIRIEAKNGIKVALLPRSIVYLVIDKK